MVHHRAGQGRRGEIPRAAVRHDQVDPGELLVRLDGGGGRPWLTSKRGDGLDDDGWMDGRALNPLTCFDYLGNQRGRFAS